MIRSDRCENTQRLAFSSDQARWEAVVSRNKAADGSFVYAVRTTGVFCRPSCPSRPAKRENVSFFDSPVQAETAGYRACKRCRPLDETANAHAAIALNACKMIDSSEQEPDLAMLAHAAGLSRWHFQRLFKAEIGLTPKQYAIAQRKKRLRQGLGAAESVTDAILDAGYTTNSRAYNDAKVLGMTPSAYRSGGAGEVIHWCSAQSSLGEVVIAATEVGICMIEFGSPDDLVSTLRSRFPKARILAADSGMPSVVREVVALIDGPAGNVHIPLDIRGTAFQEKVWRALMRIPPGETLSYGELAERIGMPTAARAVARACASNHIAVAIPCHRVVSGTGDLTGYKWGLDRKRELLEREGVTESGTRDR